MADSEPTLDRRAFFRQLVKKTGKAVVKQVDGRVTKRAGHWIRPPFALVELDFLLACTRCNDCIDACSHSVIFPLPTRLGAQVAATPALDLLNKGCHCCEDWPCVTACEVGALHRPEDEDGEPLDEMPRLAIARMDQQKCLAYQGPECGACAASCPIKGALTWKGEKPSIDPAICNGCGRCREACIMEPKAVTVESLHHQADATEA